MMLEILGHISGFMIGMWFAASTSLLFGYGSIEVSRLIYHEIRPFYWMPLSTTYLIYKFVSDGEVVSNILLIIILVSAWIGFKDLDKDDRWKKRLEKGLGVVKSLGHRLTVVNEGA